MANHVCNGAMLKCSMGIAPSSLIVVPANRVMTSSQPAATIMDNKPMVNVMPFGMCRKSTAPPARIESWARSNSQRDGADTDSRLPS